MGLLFNFSKKRDFALGKEELVENNVCPNCWGKQEYDQKFRDLMKDSTKSEINKDAANRKAFIQKFVENHVEGIHLKNEHGKLNCMKCKLNYD